MRSAQAGHAQRGVCIRLCSLRQRICSCHLRVAVQAAATAAPEAQAELALEVCKPLPWDEDFKRHFIDKYWQKSPLLIRQAYPSDWRSPIEPDELAGFACEDTPSDDKASAASETDASDAGPGDEDVEEQDVDEDDPELQARVIVKVCMRSALCSVTQPGSSQQLHWSARLCGPPTSALDSTASDWLHLSAVCSTDARRLD